MLLVLMGSHCFSPQPWCTGTVRDSAISRATVACERYCAESTAAAAADGSACAPYKTTPLGDTSSSGNNLCASPVGEAQSDCYWPTYDALYARHWHASCDPAEYEGPMSWLDERWNDPEEQGRREVRRVLVWPGSHPRRGIR